MANVLNTDRQIAIIAALAEGSSIRAIARITAYAWSHETDDLEQPKRSVTVLKTPPAVFPETAVRVAIMQEMRDAETA